MVAIFKLGNNQMQIPALIGSSLGPQWSQIKVLYMCGLGKEGAGMSKLHMGICKIHFNSATLPPW